MSKILIAGDFHGNHKWAKRVIDLAYEKNISKIMQVGDFGIWPGKEGDEYLYILDRYLTKHNIRLYFLPGNHEDWNQLDLWQKEGPKTLEGFTSILNNIYYTGKINNWIWENKKFAVVGGATSIDRKWRKLNESWWPQEALTNKEVIQARDIGKSDYLFTHDTSLQHPFEFLSYNIESEIHRGYMSEIGSAIRSDLWFHGHYHEYDEYKFSYGLGYSKVYSLDCDGTSLSRNTVILDIETGGVSKVDTAIW